MTDEIPPTSPQPLIGQLHLDRQQAAPLHQQLADKLRSLMKAGRLVPGDELPGEIRLARALGVSRQTVRQALGTLRVDGLVERKRGTSTTVVERHPRVPLTICLDRLYAFAWEARARGVEHHSRVLDSGTVPAAAAVAAHLQVATGSTIWRIERLRLADAEPLVLETAYLSLYLAAPLDAETLKHGALYDTWEHQLGLHVTHAREQIRPIHLDRRAAGLLGVHTRSPAFAVERVAWAGEHPLEMRESVVRGDRYLFALDLIRDTHPAES